MVDLVPQANKLRLETKEDLCRVPLLCSDHTTSVQTSLAATEAETIHQVLKKNVNLFSWTTFDMLGYHNPQALGLQGGTNSSSEKAQAWGGEEVRNKRGSREAPSGRFHTRSPLYYLVSQCSHGNKSQWQVEDVCQLHQPQQGVLKRLIPSLQHRLTSGQSGRS